MFLSAINLFSCVCRLTLLSSNLPFFTRIDTILQFFHCSCVVFRRQIIYLRLFMLTMLTCSCCRLVVARLPAARKLSGSNYAAEIKFVFSQKLLRYEAHGTGCTLTAVPMLTQPFTLRGTVNEYQRYGWVMIPMAMGECSAYISLHADSEEKFADWPTSWRPPGADRLSPRGTKVNSRIWLAP